MTTPAIDTIIQILEKLPPQEQKKAVKHLQNYLATAKTPTFPKGKSGRKLLSFAGAISQPELNKMQQAIQIACEQVDKNDW